jgi:DNA-binding winged helix-turn-helix (wHTH) protein
MSFTALGCKVDPLLRSVTDASGRTTRLEPKACDLLVLLAGRPGEVISASSSSSRSGAAGSSPPTW